MLHGISHSNRRTRRRYEALERVSFSVGILPTVLDSTMSNGTPGKPPYLSGVEVSESSVLPAQFSRVQISAQLCAIAEGALSPGALLSDKVKPRSPRHRFLIALHSPYGVVETGLLGCPPEKNAAKLTYSVQQCSFSGQFLGQE